MDGITKKIDEIAIELFEGNNSKFAAKMSTSEANIRNYRTRMSPKLEFVVALINKLEINYEWLINDEGKMRKERNYNAVNEPEGQYKVLLKTDKKLNQIPLVSVKAIGGFGNSTFSIKERDVKDHYIIPKFRDKKIDFMIEIEGSSMYPKYNSGDVVACLIINEASFIQWNKTHVIATKDQGIIIKRIKQGKTDKSLLMVSDNKDYPEFEVPRKEITGIALVVGVIRLE